MVSGGWEGGGGGVHGSGQAAINSDKELESRANSAGREGRKARAKNKTLRAGKRQL